MNRKFRIAEFESNFPAGLLDEGLELSQLRERWKVEEDKSTLKSVYTERSVPPVHTRIDRTKQFILNYSCDCIHFNRLRGCKHITGLLYFDKNKSIRLTPVNESRRVGVDELLDVIQTGELTAFIRFYASNNLTFNKIFKQFFSYKFTRHGKDFDDYINQLIQSYMDVSGKLDNKAKRQLFQIFEMHLLRAEDLILANDWTGAVEIISALLIRSFQLHFEENIKNATQLIDRTHRDLAAIISQNLAPSLRRKINKLSAELIGHPGYRHFKSPNAVDLAIRTLDGNFDEIRQIIEQKIKNAPAWDKAAWLMQLFRSDIQTGRFDLIDFYSTYLDDPVLFISFIKIADEEQVSNVYLNRILEISIKKLVVENRNLTSAIASYLIHTEKDVLYRQLFERFISEGIRYSELNSSILISSAIEKKELAIVISDSEIFDLIRADDPEAYAEILYKSGQPDQLIRYFRSAGTLAGLADYIPFMMAADPEQTVDIIKAKSKAYLDEHLGSRSSDLIEEIIIQLDRNKYFGESDELKDFIRDNYQDRKHLIKSLK